MIQLLATPERFDGKQVTIVGFVNIEFEGDSVYPSEGAYQDGIFTDAIWLDVPKAMADRREMFQRKYVFIEGRFSAHDHGHMGMFAGTLTDVVRYIPVDWDELQCSIPLIEAESDAPSKAVRELALSFIESVHAEDEGSLEQSFASGERDELRKALSKPDSRFRWLLFDWELALKERFKDRNLIQTRILDVPGSEDLVVACICDAADCEQSWPVCLSEVATERQSSKHVCLSVVRGDAGPFLSFGYFRERAW